MGLLFKYHLDLLLLVAHDQAIQNLLIELPEVLIKSLLLQWHLVDQAIEVLNYLFDGVNILLFCVLFFLYLISTFVQGSLINLRRLQFPLIGIFDFLIEWSELSRDNLPLTFLKLDELLLEVAHKILLGPYLIDIFIQDFEVAEIVLCSFFLDLIPNVRTLALLLFLHKTINLLYFS